MNKRKIISSVVAASVLSIGMSMGICAKTLDTSNSIGRLEFLTIANTGFKTARASTSTSTASKPATGYAGTVIMYTTNEKGTVKEVSSTSANSVTEVSRSAASGHYLVKARGIHKQLYMNNVILTENTQLP